MFCQIFTLGITKFFSLAKIIPCLVTSYKTFSLAIASLGNIIFPNSTSAIRPVKQIQGHIQIHQSSLVITDYMLDHTWCRVALAGLAGLAGYSCEGFPSRTNQSYLVRYLALFGLFSV